jgi:hypothetical protein
MLKKTCLCSLIIFFISCKNAPEKSSAINTFSDTTFTDYSDSAQYEGKVETTTVNDTTELAEFFVDSLTVGRKSYNKFELSYYRTTDSFYTVINFYSKKNNKWILRNEFVLPKDGVLGCDVEVSDYNNDGYNDITYVSAVAARGANQIRTLFIYDKQKDNLTHIKNSESYCNLQYNKNLKCIDAFNVYGGCMSYFLNLVGDSLKPFASVELYEGLTITEYDKKGNEKVILKDSSVKATYIRYKSYKPLKEYEDY